MRGEKHQGVMGRYHTNGSNLWLEKKRTYLEDKEEASKDIKDMIKFEVDWYLDLNDR